ncbi:MAG TPA: glycosyltransferase family 2 protein [Puia sp.]|jgi:glycosyltransferase involved in cell wall biosynthesis
MSKISVYIISYNEEKKIEAAIQSVIGWADEVLIFDSFSTDRTIEICNRYPVKIIQIPFEGFGKLRNDALEYCQYPWVFSLDSDERCTPEAREEILQIIREDREKGPVAYYVPRRNFFLGQWIRYSDWYPDYRQPQLFRKGKLIYTLLSVHERFEAEGAIGKMKNPIWQIPFSNLEQMIHKANRYSSLGAQKLKSKKKGGITIGLVHAAAEFFQTYIIKRGLLDGRAGFVIAFYNGISTFYKYAKLEELQKGWQDPSPEWPQGR